MILLEGEDLVFHNYLAQSTFLANPQALEIIRAVGEWTEIETLCAQFPNYSRASIEGAVSDLATLGALVIEGDEEAEADARFAREWLWGPFAAAFHHSTRVGSFMSEAAAVEMLQDRAHEVPSPPLYQTNPDPARDISLPVRNTYGEPFTTMSRRRTHRSFSDDPVSLLEIADCLLFSMAITAVIEDPEVIDLPLKMTPSGGARNPYEAYVAARRVEGLEPGVYHYSAMERTLSPVAGEPPPFGPLLAGQDWADGAAALIFLVANFERTMWKYHDPMAYRVVAVEAGHIGQNIMLTAAHYGVLANPTGAMDFEAVEALLGVSGPTKAVMYCLILGHAGPLESQVPA
jgi:SagB-type dehydrogenase family enzyme